jgi:rubrerythrin
MEKYSFTDEAGALTLAMEIEGKAYNLYRRLSQQAEDRNAQVVFKDMMEQELKHINYLKALKVRIADVYN